MEELEELIQELQETVNLLTEENAELQNTVDDLQKEFEGYEANTTDITKRLEALEYQMKALVNVRYQYDQNRDIVRVETSITRQMLEQGGPELLDVVYSNMKDELMRSVNSPSRHGKLI